MKCGKCGKEISEGMSFCIHCGTSVGSLAQESKNEKQSPASVQGQKSKKTVAILAVAGVLVLAVLVVTVWKISGILSEKGETISVDKDIETEIQKEDREPESFVSDTAEAKAPEISVTENQPENNTETAPVAGYSDVCRELLLKNCVNVPEQDLMGDMLSAVTNSYALTSPGVFDMKEIGQETLKSIVWGSLFRFDSASYGLPVEGYADSRILFDEELLDSFMTDFLGVQVQEWEASENSLVRRDEGTGMIAGIGADGERAILENALEVRENDDFYLVSAPYMYYSNGDESGLEYVLDALFAKNESSRFGVTLCYIETRGKTDVGYAEVSSELPPYKNKSYGGNKLIDGDITTPWVEGVDGNGEGETIVLHMAEPARVYGVLIYGGYLESEKLFESNGKPSYVRVDFGSGNVTEAKLGQDMYEKFYLQNPDIVQLPQSVVTDTITITILGAEAGSKYQDTCIGEIIVY